MNSLVKFIAKILRAIAHFLGECFTSRGWDVYVTDLQDGAPGTPEVGNFSAVLIGRVAP